jgi:hypothetical protein
MNNPCILVTSHLNTQHKIDAALEVLSIIKTYGLPIVYVGNHPLPTSIQDSVDYSFVTSYNPPSSRETLSEEWKACDKLGGHCNFKRVFNDYGMSHLLLIKKGIEVCDILNFDFTYHFNYDVKMSKNDFDLAQKHCKTYDSIFCEYPNYGCETIFFAHSIPKLLKIFNVEIEANYNNWHSSNNQWICEHYWRHLIEKQESPTVYKTTNIESGMHVNPSELKLPHKSIQYSNSVDSYYIDNKIDGVFWDTFNKKYFVRNHFFNIDHSPPSFTVDDKPIGYEYVEQYEIKGYLLDCITLGEYKINGEFLFKDSEELKRTRYIQVLLSIDENGNHIYFE